jgi:hypothetical protein
MWAYKRMSGYYMYTLEAIHALYHYAIIILCRSEALYP